MTARNIVLAGAAAAIVWASGAGPSAAQQYPFCRSSESGQGDCRYDTLQQCQAATSGGVGYCQPNYFLPPAGASQPRRRAGRS